MNYFTKLGKGFMKLFCGSTLTKPCKYRVNHIKIMKYERQFNHPKHAGKFKSYINEISSSYIHTCINVTDTCVCEGYKWTA